MKRKLSIVLAITLTLILSLAAVAFASGQAAEPEANNLAQDAEQGLSGRGGGGAPQPLAVQNAIRYKSGSWTGVESCVETANPSVSPFRWSWVRAFVQHYSGGHNYFGEFGWEKRWPHGPRYRLVWQNESGHHGEWGTSVEPGSLHWYKIQNTDGDTVWNFYLDLDPYDSKELSFSATTRVASGGEVSASGVQMGPSDCKWNKYRHDSTWSYYSGKLQPPDPGYHADLIDTYHWNVWGPDEGGMDFTSSTNSGEANAANWEEKEVATEAEAITKALEVAKMHGLVGEPTSAAAGQMTWGEFLELVKEEPSPRRASDTIVWVVSIKGNVVIANPPSPDGTPSHSEYDNIYVVLEANTGIDIREGAFNPGYEPEWPF